jgi:hypothetical protein
VSARDAALAEAADQVLAGIADVAGFCARLEAVGGCGKLIGAIRSRLLVRSPVRDKPLAAVWAEAAERMVAQR